MVTKRLIRISPEEKAAAAAGDSKRGENKLQKAGSSGDNNKIDTTEVDVQLQRRQATDGAENHEIDGGKSEAVANCQQNDNASKKRSLPLEGSGDNDRKRLRKRGQKFIDLSDVPDQLPILKSNRKSVSSKYQGVSFYKTNKKWTTHIHIDRKQRTIDYYDNEEEAARDYARAVYKYRGGKAAVEREQQKRQKVIDLSDVPEQLPILRNRIDGSSKYQGVTLNKVVEKWQAQIMFDGKQRSIGYYDNEEEASTAYARAVFKFWGGMPAVEREQ